MTRVGDSPGETRGTAVGAVSRASGPNSPRRDVTLPHQVIVQTGDHGQIEVSCNCRKVRRNLKAGKHMYEPMGSGRDFPTLVRVFNNPENHNEAIGWPGTKWAGLRVPFGKEWMLDGLSGQGV